MWIRLFICGSCDESCDMILSTSTDDHCSKLQTSSPARAAETPYQQKQHQNATPHHKQKLVPK